MELRSLRLDPGIRLPRSEATGALAGLIGCIGDEAFGQRGIEQLARLLPLGWWTVYRIFDDAPPALHFGA